MSDHDRRGGRLDEQGLSGIGLSMGDKLVLSKDVGGLVGNCGDWHRMLSM